MLLIRNEQLARLSDLSDPLLAKTIRIHLARHHARAVVAFDEAEMRRHIAFAMRAARASGMVSPRGIGLFVALMFEFGPGLTLAPEIAGLGGPQSEAELDRLIARVPAAFWDDLPAASWPAQEPAA